MDITVYSSPTCPYCRMVKEFLSQKGAGFTELDVSRDSAAARELVSSTGQMGVPVTVIDGQVIVGFDRAQLERALTQGQQRQRLSFGAAIADASKITARLGTGITFGAYVGKVKPGSVAAKVGLAQNDIITELNMQRIANAGDLEHALSKLDRGSHFSLVFLRGDRTFTAEGMF